MSPALWILGRSWSFVGNELLIFLSEQHLGTDSLVHSVLPFLFEFFCKLKTKGPSPCEQEPSPQLNTEHTKSSPLGRWLLGVLCFCEVAIGCALHFPLLPSSGRSTVPWMALLHTHASRKNASWILAQSWMSDQMKPRVAKNCVLVWSSTLKTRFYES